MAKGISVFTAPGLNVYFYSQRVNVNSNPTKHLVDFINGAKKSLIGAIYDMQNPAVLLALKSAAKRLNTNLHIVYDAGKGKPKPGTAPDPKNASATGKMIRKYGLDRFATAVHVKGGNLMHDKFLVRDAADLWTGSGNFTKGGLTLQDNNFMAIHSPDLAKVYTDAYQGLMHPNHPSVHAPKGPKI